MQGLSGILSIIKKMNTKFFTSQEIEEGKFIINFKGASAY